MRDQIVNYEEQISKESRNRNLGIFSGLNNAIIVGRPKDPSVATNRRIKYAIVVVFCRNCSRIWHGIAR